MFTWKLLKITDNSFRNRRIITLPKAKDIEETLDNLQKILYFRQKHTILTYLSEMWTLFTVG